LRYDVKNLSINTCEAFTTLMDYKKCPKGWGRLDSNQRRREWRDLQSVGSPNTSVSRNT